MAKYKNGQYGIEVRIPHYLAGTDKERLAASVLKEFAGEVCEEYRVFLKTGEAYKVYKACYNGSGVDLEGFQALWNYNLLQQQDQRAGEWYNFMYGVKVFPGETLIYTLHYQDADYQQFYPTDPLEEYGVSQFGIDYARDIMREIHRGNLLYYPMLRGEKDKKGNEKHFHHQNAWNDVTQFDSEAEALAFLKQYDEPVK